MSNPGYGFLYYIKILSRNRHICQLRVIQIDDNDLFINMSFVLTHENVQGKKNRKYSEHLTQLFTVIVGKRSCRLQFCNIPIDKLDEGFFYEKYWNVFTFKKNIHRLNLEMCYKNKIFGTDFIVYA